MIKICQEKCFSIPVSVIVGLEGKDGDIFNGTIKFIFRIKPFLTVLSVLMVYPGTGITNKPEAENRLLHKDWSKYRGVNVDFSPKL